MNFELIGVITVIVGLGVLFAPVHWAFTFMVISTALGSAAAFNLPALGGASVLVPNVFLLFFCARIFMAYGEGPVLAAYAPPKAGFWLLVLTMFGLMTAILLPRLFQGTIDVLTVERSVGARSIVAHVPLRFSSSNITQAIYALGGAVCFGLCYAYIRRTAASAHLINVLLIVAAVNLGFAVADVLTYFTGTEQLLEFVRTANYALLTASEKGGFKRISGAFPEASAFADYTLVLFAAIASLWLDRIRSRVTGPMAAALLVALVLSTSATALVGLAVVVPFLWSRSVASALGSRRAGRTGFLLAVAALMPLALMMTITLFPATAESINQFLDEILLSKADSQSGRERMAWNAAAYQTFLDTSGLGAGLGSARASSYLLVLLSNVGVPGTAAFCLFVAATLRSRMPKAPSGDGETASVVRAAKAGLVAGLTTSLISGTVYDLGLTFYILAGSISALTYPRVTMTQPARAHLAGASGRRHSGSLS
ncbi:hypothetical protein [Sinorhizobium fredii]|uniref:Uncharacterized protein n=1 Tax=Rhizobium fredii TaxID=380 RepID=A0A2L0HF65_RHIFR|nr:hypothetical protein [Sinorhizobium fredii]AUX80126.1 hypothetical protein NXT3_PC00969 [Sinorhizobium fredii]